MVAMVDPFAATALLHHQIAASVLPAAHPNYEACQEGTVLASLCLDQAIHAYPRENASRYVLRSAPAEKDPLPTAPITAVNASITKGGPVLVRAWVHNSTADPTLQWLAVDLKDLPPRGTPSKLSRHLDVDRVVVPASNVLHPVTASSHTGLPQLYHGAACHGASKILLHNSLFFLDTSYHHAIRPPYATRFCPACAHATPCRLCCRRRGPHAAARPVSSWWDAVAPRSTATATCGDVPR